MQPKDLEGGFPDVVRRYNSALIRLSPTTSGGSPGSLSIFYCCFKGDYRPTYFWEKTHFEGWCKVDGGINPAGNCVPVGARGVSEKGVGRVPSVGSRHHKLIPILHRVVV